MKVNVKDKAVEDRDVHVEDQVGTKQWLTPEGFLYCEAVPIARIGIQDYLNSELVTGAEDDMVPGKNGTIQVERNEDEVFHPRALASFEGKDVVIDHPDDDVQPHNYKQYSVGVTLHPRRGDGEWSDFVVADLLVKDKDGIEYVQKHKPQVSCGYDAEYRSLGPGRAQQYDIVGNHVALLTRGRCGRKCKIGDREMTKKTGVLDRIMTAFTTKDKAAFDEAMGELGAQTMKEPEVDKTGPEAVTETHVHIHMPGEKEAGGNPDGDATKDEIPGAAPAADPMEARIAAIEATLAKIAEMMAGQSGEGEGDEDVQQQGEEEAEGAVPGKDTVDAEPGKDDEDKDKKGNPFKDSAHLVEDFKVALSGAEIIAPGLKLPTLDSAAKPKSTRDGICLLKRRALAASLRTDDGAEILEQLTGKRTLDGSMPCSQLGVIFNGAVALTKDRNTVIERPRLGARPAKDKAAPDIKTPADFNASMREHYKQPPATR